MTLSSVLVANRGEIACRIMRTAQRLGLRTVAVFSEPDRGAPHVRMADDGVRLGPGPARESYLRADAIVEAALRTGADAIHPGYGLLSEDAAFARAVEAAGLRFAGPTPRQLELFGDKHAARALARAQGVPMIAGSVLLADAEEAVAAAEAIGWPVMLKATAGGGGIGLAPCRGAVELREAFERVTRLAGASFGAGGVFLERYVERARHVEVQVFGDGAGRVLALGDRDCSLQRRHQKVVEEAPAPGIPGTVRERIHAASAALCAAASYRSAGTVEFVYDAEREEASFLEVNARLQVEHPVTEELLGIDLVEWMLRLAGGDASMLDDEPPGGWGRSLHAIEARIYAEDPAAGHRPSPGLITSVSFPAGLRVDGWVDGGTEVSPHYDPLLAKVVATGATREEARARLREGLRDARVHGIRTNLGLLRAALRDPAFAGASHTTATLDTVVDAEPRIEVLRAGTMTTVQDWPGRVGLWHVGVPPSGPMDDLAFRLGTRVLGNPAGAPGLECTLEGPRLRFSAATEVCVTGADARVTLDDEPVPQFERVAVPAGAILDVGTATGRGLRTYVLVAGGLDVPEHLDSAATFTLGNFGGHGGRALRIGDVLEPGPAPRDGGVPVAIHERPPLLKAWTIGVTEGPHADPELFAPEDLDMLYATDWEVHFNSARTGVRLVGPRPRWPRPDGGEAGLHPSNIHDTPYAIGSVDFTGDVPIVLGPDGPSLGGFVCPAVVATDERWKLGQLRPGDTARLARRGPGDGGVLGRREESDDAPSVTWRRAGDDNLLVEYGPMTLDLGLRMRVHALAERIEAERLGGIVDLTAGIRSLQVHVDPDRLSVARIREIVTELEDDLPATRDLEVSSREVRLPLSWDDPATRLAIERYMANVRPDAPWCPWNIEFIRRVNGLESVDDVHRIVFDAEYLVLGLGDVYLGAPVATPLDPRHRLVTTKYNPARTWTPENAVGIGGAYLCVYGMEGPGGYQFVGRTVQVWDAWSKDIPWLLRPFDRISWHPVEAEELLELRADLPAGRLDLDIRPGSFRLADHIAFCEREAAGIAAFRERQRAAFAAEREAWAAAGEFDAAPAAPQSAAPTVEVTVPDGGVLVEAPLSASVWRVDVQPGDAVRAGDRLLTLEAMKTETAIESPVDGSVHSVMVGAGDQVLSGSALIVMAPL